MQDLHLSYDQKADVLYIAFEKNRRASSVSLNDSLVLRFDAQTRQAVGLTIMDFSRLVKSPTALPLTRLDEFPAELRDLVWDILTRPPISHYLRVEGQRRSADLVREFSLANMLLAA